MNDRTSLPPIRVQRVGTSQRPSEDTLVTDWLQAWNAKRESIAQLAALRGLVEARLDRGEAFENSLGYVLWQESIRMSAEPKSIYTAMGPQVFLQCIEVSSTKLRALVEEGAIPRDADWLRIECARRMVTKLR